MTPKTQSVCKHCQQPIDFPGQLCPMGRINCVSEPASTGEPQQKESDEAFWKYLDENREAVRRWPGWMRGESVLAARPSEPSAPHKLGCHFPDTPCMCNTITVVDAAPQTSTEPGFTKGYKYHGYANEPVSDACGDGKHSECTFDLTKCHCKYRAGHNTMHSYANPRIAAPQPVSGDAPGDFTEAELVAIERSSFDGSQLWRLARQLRERTAEREAYDSQRKYLLKKLAVAGTQPTPDKMQQEMAGLRFRIHNLERHNQYFFRCESAWCHPADKQFQNPALETFKEALAISAGAAQGTPQVEEVIAHERQRAVEICDLTLDRMIDRDACARAIRNPESKYPSRGKHLVGAPAQPGPIFSSPQDILKDFPAEPPQTEPLATQAQGTPEPPKVEDTKVWNKAATMILEWLRTTTDLRFYARSDKALIATIAALIEVNKPAPYFPPASQTPDTKRGWMGSRGQFDAGDE